MARLSVPNDVKADIIVAIQKLPELWDRDSGITNKKIIESSWEKVARQIGIPAENIKSQWQILKKNYTDHLTGKRMTEPELVLKMQFMHYILSAPKQKRTSISNATGVKKNVSFNQPGGSKATKKLAQVKKEKKITKPATVSSNDIKICSWIAGYLLGHDTIMSSSMKQFKYDMLEMLFFHKPHIVSEVLMNPFASRDLNIPSEVCQALKLHNDSKS